MANDWNPRVASSLIRLALTLSTGAALCSAANASGGPPEPTSCNFAAFVEETDPAGLNVRAEPSASAKVLGTLPPIWSDAYGMRARVFVKVTASSNGWFLVREAFEDEALTGRPARPVYDGEGWVSGRKLVVKAQAGVGHTRPDAKAPIAARLKDGVHFDGSSTMAAGRLVDCKGSWALVDYDESKLPKDLVPYLEIKPAARAGLPKGRFRAWLDQICGIQETTCDGPSSQDTQ